MPSRRRPRGLGGVHQDTRGRWVAQFDFEGQRYRRVRTTEAAAWEALEDLRRTAHSGVSVAPSDTVAAYLAQWLEGLRVRPTTARGYRTYVEQYLVPTIGDVRLDRLTPARVERMLRDLERGGLAPRSVSHARAILRNALSRAVRHGLVTRNAAELAEPVPVPNAQRRILTPEQAKVLRDSYRGDRLEAMYVIAMTLGLRMSELLGLRWEDVALPGDASQGQGRIQATPRQGTQPVNAGPPRRQEGSRPLAASLHIRQTLHHVEGRTVVAPPKTPRSERRVPVTDEIAALLAWRRTVQRAEYLASGARPAHDLVFTGEAGEPLTGSAVTHRFKTRCAQLGLPPVSFHDLRHVAASNLQARGLTLVEVQAILGHASVTTTANVYSHADDGVVAGKLRGLAW